ncbi:MAG: hypothetical protein J5I93_07620 [Pirellulaceae bacterium]|nr:hypothetical protein [Pirellulaceae bacterium]
MPFNPKLVTAAEPSADGMDELDGQLPDDLRALAAQLTGEAQQLSELYPARDLASGDAVNCFATSGDSDSGDSESGNHGRPGRQRRWLAVGLSGLLAGGLLAVVGWVAMQPRGTVAGRHGLPQAGDSVATRPGFSAASQDRPESTASAPGEFSTQPDGGRQEPVVELHAPGWFLQEVSGPELEGLLDLLEEQPEGSWNISI